MRYGSVCSGIEAATAAWHPLGWQPAWFSEIEAFPSAVLAHRYPSTPNLGNMLEIPDMLRTGLIDAPDVLVGGTPCQAFSIAGNRQSLDDARGNLTLTYCEILDEIDIQRNLLGQPPAIAVWENVPGVFTTKDNAFGCLLARLAGESVELQPPGGKWANAGYVSGPSRAVAWRTLDAQHFGVAQRRRRVFVVASSREGACPAEILFEFDGVRRDSAPCREAAKIAAAAARSGTAFRMLAFGEYDDDDTASTMKARDYKDATDLVVHGTQDPDVLRDLAHTLGRNSGQENAVFEPRPIHDKATRFKGGNLARNLRDDGSGNGLGISEEGDPYPCLGASDIHAFHAGMTVRRIMPVEGERLQGFPDGYTDIPAAKDTPRYKAIGNSMAVPCMGFIGTRIARQLETVKQENTMTIATDQPAHAPFGPSAAARLYDCPASHHIHQNKDSIDAATGTVAHEIHERVLNGELACAADAIGEHHEITVNDQSATITVDAPMAEAVQESIDEIWLEMAVARDAGVTPALFVEIRVDISVWTPIPNQFGTADVILVCGNTLHVYDYKHGAGVRVDAEENLQTLLYGLGAYEYLRPLWPEIDNIVMHIHQPRNGGFSSWTMGVQEMLERGAVVADRLKLCLSPNAPYGATERACKFCSGKPTCPEYAKRMHDMYVGAFDELPLTVKEGYEIPAELGTPFDAKLLDSADLAKLWPRLAAFKSWIETVATEIEHRVLSGEKLDGIKLVEGRKSRVWAVDEPTARVTLCDLGIAEGDLYKLSFVTPPQAEELLPKGKRKDMESLWKRMPGKPTVVAESDKRKAIDPAALVDAFDDCTAETDNS